MFWFLFFILKKTSVEITVWWFSFTTINITFLFYLIAGRSKGILQNQPKNQRHLCCFELALRSSNYPMQRVTRGSLQWVFLVCFMIRVKVINLHATHAPPKSFEWAREEDNRRRAYSKKSIMLNFRQFRIQGIFKSFFTCQKQNVTLKLV